MIALLFTLVSLHDFGLYGGSCPSCGKKGKHADDCFWKEHE